MKLPNKRPRHDSRARQSKGENQNWITLPDPDNDDSDGEVEVVQGPGTERVVARQQKKEAQQPITDLAGRFKQGKMMALGHNQQTLAALEVDSIIDKQGSKEGQPRGVLSSPDELSSEAYSKTKVPNKKVHPPSPSISNRGNIQRTKFSNSLHDTSTLKEVDHATNVIGSRLCIRRAVSGDFKYETGGVEQCSLKLGRVSHILHPTDSKGTSMKQYSYITINLMKVQDIRVSMKPNCCIVSISRSTDGTISASPKLLIEFLSPEDLEHFKQWVVMHKEGVRQTPLSIDKQYVYTPPCLWTAINAMYRDRLEKELENMMAKATKSRVVRDDDLLGDDMKLIEHNAATRTKQGESANRPHVPSRQGKTKDMMNRYGSTSQRNPAIKVQSGDRQQHDEAQRQLRATRSKLAPQENPPLEKEPPTPGWTTQNKGWETKWRNSLIFPSQGKSRATVDKEDIVRLNEGEYLNDNLIIFYLRYLQHSLEANRPDLAQRIYFQNTFFYEKLKSGRTHHGINYNSVKAWTSKVDLFSKDYIIVPINEYSHWYVAIIYNAPKLVPCPDKIEKAEAKPRESATIEEDGNGGESSTSSDDQKLDDSASSETVVPTIQIDMVNQLSRMSISSPDYLDKKAKQTAAATNPGEQKTDLRMRSHDQDTEVNLVKSDLKEDEPEALPANDNMLPKKPGKRLSAGPRKLSPDQTKIITLDSLGISHSPACSCLKQYLIAELKDKKGIEIPTPGALGMTAKGIPQQTNYCDCGLYLLGYIQEFLKDPDKFVRSLLRHDDEIAWNLEPSGLRNSIRDLIFTLQKEQQDRENAHKEEKREEKRKLRMSKKRKASVTDEQPSQQEASLAKEKDINRMTLKLPLVAKNDITEQNLADHAALTKEKVVKQHVSNPPEGEAGEAARKLFNSEVRPSSSNSEAACPIPGSFPQSPAVEKSTGTGSMMASMMASVDGAKRREAVRFVSPLYDSSRGSSPSRPMVVDDSEASQGLTQECTFGRGDPKPMVSSVEIPEDIAQPHKQDKQDTQSCHQEKTQTTSHYFAGRQPGDRMASAKLRDEPTPTDIVDISD